MQATYDGLSSEVADLLAQEQAAQEAAAAAAAQNVVDRSASQATGNTGGAGVVDTPTNNPSPSPAPTPENPSPAPAPDPTPAPTPDPGPSYNPSTGNSTVDRAYGAIGSPYVWGATGPSSFDCSGLVGYALTGGTGRIGTTYTFMAWPQVSDPQPGDIATSSYHCGVYIGGGQMIHAPQPGESVTISAVQGDMIIVRAPW